MINKPRKMMCFCYEKKYWANRRVLLEWKKTHMHQISSDHHTKEDGFKYYLLILQDKLDDQVQKQSQYMFQEEYNTLC